jgi:lambda family phage tail tape measure protein
MPQSLGSIYVELSANTAKFVDGLSKAAYVAQKSAKDISREFASLQRVASQTFGAFGQFNPVISQMSFALSEMGRAAAAAMKEFGKAGSGIGAIASLAAGAAAALATVEAGAIGVAMHAAESAKKLNELSESTGVSIEALSGLGFVAKEAGVSAEDMTRGLEKMNKSVFAAATAPVGAVNAYTRLGVAVRDSSGQIRSTEAIFTDIAGKFAGMGDGVVKTALAMEIFGRSGAALIPVLNQDKESIQEVLTYAQKTGAILSGEAAESATKFERTLGLLGIAASGAENRLMVELLPSLEAIANALAETGANGQPRIITIIHDIAEAIKLTLGVINTWGHAFAQIGETVEVIGRLVIGVFNAIGAAGEAVGRALIFDFSGAEKAAKDGLRGLTGAFGNYFEDSRKRWKDNADFINSLTFHPNFTLEGGFAAGEAFAKRTKPPANVPGAGKLGPVTTVDIVGEAIGKLQAEAAAQLALASATDRSTASMLFQKAAAEAAQKVSDLRVNLLAQEKTLEEQLANARANPTTAGGEEAAKVEARIAGVRKELAALDAAAPQFTKLYSQIAAARASAATSDEFQKKTDEFDRQITSLREVAASYSKGPAAVAAAQIDQQLEAEKEKIDDLRDEYARLQAIPGIGVVGAAQGQGPSPALAELSAAIDAATTKFGELKTQAATLRNLGIDAELNKQSAELAGATPLVEALNRAYLENEQAVRQAQVALELYRWTQAHPGATADQINAENEALRAESNQAYASAIAQEAAQYDIVAAYNFRIEKLEQIRELIQSEGSSTLLIDAAIYDAQRQQIEQWDQAAMKAGTFGEQMHAVLNQVALDAQDVGGKIADAMNKAINGVEDNIAKLIVTGRANFKQLFESFAESMIKIQLQSAGGAIEKAIGIKIPGLEGKRGDSAGNPLFVKDVSTGNLPLTPGAGKSLTSLLGLGAPGTGTTPPFLGDLEGNLPLGPGFGSGSPMGLLSLLGVGGGSGGGGGLLSLFGGGGGGGLFSGLAKIGSMFAGFLAGGGPADHGSAYVVGEKGPELFVPKTSGTIVPSFSLMKTPTDNNPLASVGEAFNGYRAAGGEVTPGHSYVVGERHPEVFVSKTRTAAPAASGGDRGSKQTVVNFHVHGVSDPDSFRRSQSQIYANLHAQMELAGARG